MSYVTPGLGSYYYPRPWPARRGLRGLGVVGPSGGVSAFDAAQAWAGWVACGRGAAGQAQCKAAIDRIRVALGQLGYGQLAMGGMWTGPDIPAWKSFLSAASQPSSEIPTRAGLDAMQAILAAGQKPGPQPAVEYVRTGDTYTPAGALGGASKASLVIAGLVAAGVLGAVVVLSKREKGARPAGSEIMAAAAKPAAA